MGAVVDAPEPVGRYFYDGVPGAPGGTLRVRFKWAETDEDTSQDERSSDSTPPNIVNEHALPEAELLRLLERHFDFE